MRRLVIYLFFDSDGVVDDYVLHKLTALRTQVEYIHVISNSTLDLVARGRLESVADAVIERENVGFDVGAYDHALRQIGRQRLSSYDEVLLLNYTFFGPVGSFDPVFAEMDAAPEIDFWGLTEHAEARPHPFRKAPLMHAHIQSHWIAVRRRLIDSDDFWAYWDEMPPISSYFDSVNFHESRFTHHFESLGYRKRVAFPAADFATGHPVMHDADSMIAAGLPIVKRRLFFHDPLYLDRRAIDVRAIASQVRQSGFPMPMLLANLARTSVPRNLVTNLGLLDVLPHQALSHEPAAALRIAVLIHVYYVDMTDELLARVDHLPGTPRIVITTSDEDRAAQIRAIVDSSGREAEVRVAASNRGRDLSAFLLTCRDVIESDEIDLIVKLHSKKSPQDAAVAARQFAKHLYENLLPSPGYAANVVQLFAAEPTLGIVMPPVLHRGYRTLGGAWFANKSRAKAEAERLGITLPFDESTPVATYGSMFVARPRALRPLLRGCYDWSDFPGDEDYADGALTHVLERLIAYAALSTGHHVREVLSPEYAATYYRSLEFKLQALSAEMPWFADGQVHHVRKLTRTVAELSGTSTPAPPVKRAKAYVDRRFPTLARSLRPAYRAARATIRGRRGAA